MNDLLTAEEAEDRLRRTFAVRAERMADGDGAAWSPTPTDHRLLLLDPPSEAASPAGRRVWLAVAALVAVGGLGAVAVAVRGDSTPSGDDTIVGSADTTAPPPTTPPPPATAPDCTTVTTSPPPGSELDYTLPPTSDPVPDGAPQDVELQDDPNRETIAAFSGGMADDGLAVELMIDQRSASPFAGYPGAEAIQAGENHGWFLTMEGSSERLTSVLLDFDDLMVNITGMHIDRQVMLDVAASLHRTDDGFEYTAPPGLAPTCL